ncbi:MAG: metallophosphoesterase [Firmicutes bacterium]|nr:metallophosphoesterase [Bacillota bacterium]MDD4263343.1 metallophosphoesterase [Bacillota bacterium]MDD4693073.1 metallophosphoesterase [Bacillota bacterium]
MKILIVSDKEVPNLQEDAGNNILQGIDCIISCGDLRSSYLNSLSQRANAPLFYVAGNHDFHYKYERPKGTNLDTRIVTFNNLRLVGFEGSIRYNHKLYQYTEKEMYKRVKGIRRKLFFNPHLDIVVTHAPPEGLYENVDDCHRGFQTYRKFIEKYQPKFFLHGHYHLEYGLNIEREHTIGKTKVINCVGYYLLEL